MRLLTSFKSLVTSAGRTTAAQRRARTRLLTQCRSLVTSEVKSMAILRSPAPDVPPADKPLFEMIWDGREPHLNKTAYICGLTGRRTSLGEVYSTSLRLADSLRTRGYRHGDVIATCLNNCAEFAELAHAAAAGGLVVTTINPAYTEDDMVRQYTIAQARAVFTAPASEALVRRVAARVPCIQDIFVLTDDQPSDTLTFRELVRKGREVTPTLDLDLKRDPVSVLFSSGTTGPPKGVSLTNFSLGTQLQQLQAPEFAWQNPGVDGMFVGVLSMFHVFALTNFGFFAPMMRIPTILLPEFRPDTYFDVLKKYRPTTLHLLANMLSQLSNNAHLITPGTFDSVTSILCGGAPMGKSIVNKFYTEVKGNYQIIEVWGMTEISSIGTMPLMSVGVVPGSCGVPLPGSEFKVVALDTGDELDAGDKGEILIRGPQVMLEYINNPEATASTIDADGWLRTGDVGYFDKEGNIYIVDRIKEMIKSDGTQVSPALVENLLRQYDGVADAAVVAAPDELVIEKPRAYVIRTRDDVTEHQLMEHVQQKMPKAYWLAGGVKFVDEFPKTPFGKVARQVLKRMAAEEVAMQGRI